MQHCKAGPGGAYDCGLQAWPWQSAAPRKASFLQLEAGEDAGKISVQADKPHRPGTPLQSSPSCSVSGAPCSWLTVTSPAGNRDSVSGYRGAGGLQAWGLVASRPPQGQPAYLEQGDCGAVEEAQEEEHDEGGGHGVEVLEAFLLGAHLPLCGRQGTGVSAAELPAEPTLAPFSCADPPEGLGEGRGEWAGERVCACLPGTPGVAGSCGPCQAASRPLAT